MPCLGCVFYVCYTSHTRRCAQTLPKAPCGCVLSSLRRPLPNFLKELIHDFLENRVQKRFT